jgi:hypothetical protein
MLGREARRVAGVVESWIMKRLRGALWGATLLATSALGSTEPAFQVRVDVSKVPNAAPYVQPVKALCEEWYPKINAILFGNAYPLPFKEVQVIFEPKLQKGVGSESIEAGGFADENTIRVNFPYLAHMSDDYRAMLIHELTHVNQNYKESPGTGWLLEGIADYVRHKYFERDIEPKLRELDGYPVDQVKLRKQGYRFGYTFASPFLFWLEIRKDKDLLIRLNKALREGSYSPDLFQQYCGAPLDELWREFISQSGQ